MREILFRGKRTDNKEWVEGIFETHPITKLTFIRTPNHIYFDVNMVISETVGQFTGLYDATRWEDLTDTEKKKFYNSVKSEDGKTIKYESVKDVKHLWKGRRIFEGDILKYKSIKNENKICYVMYTNGCFCVKSIYSENHPAIDIVLFETKNNVEVIGNIQDNPELLKEGD